MTTKKIREEKRRETLGRSIRDGGLKGSIDKTADKYVDPAADKLTEILTKVSPGAKVAKDPTRTLMRAALLTGLAELVDASKGMIGKIPGVKDFGPDKVEATGKFLRAYAGEQTGARTADGVFALGALVTGALQNNGFASIVNEISEASVPQIELDDDDEEEEAVEVKPAVKAVKKTKSA